MFHLRRPVLLVVVLGLAAVSGGCGAAVGTSSAPTGAVQVVASFYPLQWAAEGVSGSRAEVRSLTKPGVEPHDLELSPRDVAAIAEADLVVYLKGFQPAVDEAVRQEAANRSLDVSVAADLTSAAPPSGDDAHREETPQDEAHQEGSGATDPHFWLDPQRLAAVADAIATSLRRLDAAHAPTYSANANRLRAQLRDLDAELGRGLANCTSRHLVTSHNAFGYLARRYGLTQVGISGLTPEDEPKTADLAAAAAFVRKHDVRTIYFETLVSSQVARTVAAETGARTAVLDPIEGLSPDAQGSDYLQVMRSNLASIKQGQPCP